MATALCLIPGAAFAQETRQEAPQHSMLPPVTVQQPKKKTVQPVKKSPSQQDIQAGTGGTSATAGGSGTAVGALIKSDLVADSVTNPYRVAPSSQPHTQTFTRQDIENLHPENVFDLLSHATGVQATYQGRKRPFNLFIRGDSNFAYVIDGAYVPSFVGGRILQSLPVSAIEQVDIVRDASALTLGPLVDFASASGALNSGFIVIRTRRPEKTEAEVSTSVATYGTYKTNAFAGTTFERDGWTGYMAGFGGYATTDGPDDWNKWAEGKTGFGKFGLGYGGFFTETMIYKDHSAFGFQRTDISSLSDQKWSYDPINTLFITSNSRLAWNSANTTLLTVSMNEVTQDNVMAYYSGKATTTNHEVDQTETVNLRHRIKLDTTMLEAGGQYVHWHSPYGEMFWSGYEREEETLSAYANVEQKFFNDRLTLDASARVDDHTIDKGIELYTEATASGLKSLSYFHDRELPLATSYSTGASFVVIPNVTVSGRYSHAEQGGVSDIALDGVELSPEKQDKWEVAVAARAADYFIPTLTYFDTQVENEKVPVKYKTVNGYSVPIWGESDTHRAGVELAVKGTLLAEFWPGKLTYSTGWTHLTVADATDDIYYASIKPRDIVNVTLTEEWGPYFGTISANYVSPYKSNFKETKAGVYYDVGNYTVVDLNIGRKFRFGDYDSKVTAFGRNITDEEYATTRGYQAIGATYGLEFSVKY
ncbi:TonB-dependent receptor [Rhodomicrobium vannielii]|nr:TonB-dependent receptor plug domain-containing protein [Rhodomicrobium vannielii]